ncbi:hypothetical protein, partial [Bacillus cereus group sp. BC60]|uniref:hypothetical protein n=1 Tax=Bacillus cereus group sp. BC60 TaxID=3445283 RepID=UPI003F22800B
VGHSEASIDPTLQKEFDLVEHLLIQGQNPEVPFTPYLTKKSKNKVSKATYHTRSMGPPPKSKGGLKVRKTQEGGLNCVTKKKKLVLFFFKDLAQVQNQVLN